MGRKSTIEIDDLKKLHLQGLTDNQLAERFSVELNVIGYHRRRLGLKANHKASLAGKREAPANARAKAASAGEEFKKVRMPALLKAGENGTGKMVPVRVEVLDAMWAGLEPEDKARLVNHLIEARGR